MHEAARHAQAAVFVRFALQMRPDRRPGRGHRRCLHMLRHAGEQRFLPGQALDLPDTQRDEARQSERGRDENRGQRSV